VRERADGFVRLEAFPFRNFLKFGRGGEAIPLREIGLTANLGRIEVRREV
jgi:hypothetical protein